jgi:arginine:pyruvate transaminase
MRYAAQTERVAGKGAGAWRLHWEAQRQRAAGRDVIMLTVGDPDQRPPAAVIAATIAALAAGDTGYSPIIGYPEVRAAIAARIARRSGRPCSAENVVVAPGTQAGLFCALQCLAGAGDEVLVPEPIYAPYEGTIGASGARMVTVPLRPETGFHLDLAELARAVTPRTRVLMINTPHNPTGAVMTGDEMAAVAALCRRHDLWLLADEVYEDLAFARAHVSAWSLPEMAERTVVASSLSKSLAIPGFRMGWVVGPPELGRHLFNLLICMLYGSPPFIQKGALAALEADLPETAAIHRDYRRRAALATEILRQAPRCRIGEPEGGMFALLDIRGTGMEALSFAERLLERHAVAVVPCDGFGPSAAGHLRIALTCDDAPLAEAARRIVRCAAELA